MQRSVVMKSTDDLDDDRRLIEVSSLMFVDFDHTPDAVGGNSFLVSELVCLLPLARLSTVAPLPSTNSNVVCSVRETKISLRSNDLDYHS
jgi:hypothetical protein